MMPNITYEAPWLIESPNDLCIEGADISAADFRVHVRISPGLGVRGIKLRDLAQFSFSAPRASKTLEGPYLALCVQNKRILYAGKKWAPVSFWHDIVHFTDKVLDVDCAEVYDD